MKTRIVYFIAACALAISGTFAQSRYINNVKFENQTGVKEGGQVSVYMDILLDALKINTNDMLILTPVITSNESSESMELPPVFVTGKRRGKVLERNIVLGNAPDFDPAPQATVTRKNKSAQVVNYSAAVPFENWMSSASLTVKESVKGCVDCRENLGDVLVANRILPMEYVPTYKLTYIVPDVEPVKARADKYTATLNFRVDKHNLETSYMNNAAILAEADRIVSELVSSNDLSVSDFDIVGYASPEASVVYNKALSERRANAFADYLSNKHNVPRNRMKVSGYGEDWIKTREVIAASNIADKAEILHIIDNVANLDARDPELKKLSGGVTWQTLLRDYFPQVRRTEYTVSYVARAFNVEEAKQIIRTNPKLLSLNEMYLVAQTYPDDSKEFKEVFDIATRLYPAEPIAILNSAAADIEGGNNQAAIDRLNKIETDPRVWNNLGVAYARMGEYEKAKGYFEKAAVLDDADAQHNLQELEKTMAN